MQIPPSVHQGLTKLMQNIPQFDLELLPPALIEFLKERSIDLGQLQQPIPRFVRIKPWMKVRREELAKELGVSEEKVLQIDEQFWAIDPSVKINRCRLYEESMMYGMDIGSSIPCRCLDVQQGNRVLELCSAPGNKSMYIADHHAVEIIGVELSENRANTMRSLVKKYSLSSKIEVVLGDGVKYDHQRPFDRVLIDAECTHQGSLKHILKFTKAHAIKKQGKMTRQQRKQFEINNRNPYRSEVQGVNRWTQQDFQERFLDQFKLNNLKPLQMALLINGYRLLNIGGILVYSTCSYDQKQNQDIIEQFLACTPGAVLMDAGDKLETEIRYRRGRLKETIRLSPIASMCGGMFVSKIRKQ